MGIREAWNLCWDHTNEYIGKSAVGRYFQLEERRTTFTQELRAGTVTFLTTAYILAVNALILSDTGGPCSPDDCTGPDKGNPECVYPDDYGITNVGYMMCVERVRQSLVTATAASSCIASLLMGVGANLPVALAPGMGLNAYFAYNVVGYRGSGNVSYQTALAAVFVEGIIFVFLAVTGLRLRLIRLVPKSIMLATSAGIGLFLAFIGLQSTQGLGIISYDPATLVSLGGCPAVKHEYAYVIDDPASVCTVSNGVAVLNLPPPSSNYACDGSKMESGSMWLGIAGLMLIGILMSRSFKGSIIIGIAFVTVIAWIPGHAASYLGKASSIPGGMERLEYFKRVVDLPTLKATGGTISFSGFTSGEVWIALVTFLYVDFLDTTGTLFSMANFINNYVPGFVNEKKEFPRQTLAFCVDGVGSILGSLMGTSPIAAFIESASGIREGGRTGLTAICVALWFFVALFFTPVLSNVPPYAIGPALITVGALMMMNVVRIRWEQSAEALPAFITIILMPLTYSIAYGIIGGLLAYVVINGLNWIIDKISEFGHWTMTGNDTEVPVMLDRSVTSRMASNTGTAGLGGRPSAGNVVRAMAAAAKRGSSKAAVATADNTPEATPPVSRKPSVQDTKELELGGGRPPRSPHPGPDRV
ncbi:Adenine/guanine permease AZG1 [Coccomyxa sp. Obi]|nr:Adenine/guanine permease AZG1 [Coccomyxa sp. Obi]